MKENVAENGKIIKTDEIKKSEEWIINQTEKKLI